MAGIDKTYIPGNEYIIYRQWWIDNYNKMIESLGYYIILYPFDKFNTIESIRNGFSVSDDITPEFLYNNDDDLREFEKRDLFSIWHTDEEEDLWLIKNCMIDSYQNRLKMVYPKNWKGFKLSTS